MTDCELIFYDWQKRRNNSPSRKIEEPEAPEEQEEEYFHGRRLYLFPGNCTIEISQLLRMLKTNVLRALDNSYFLNENRLFFISKAPGLVFSTTYLRGSFAPSALPQNILGPAVSPIDTLRKDSALRLGRARRGPPVTSENPPSLPGCQRLLGFAKVS
jgi:hypothetical protein